QFQVNIKFLNSLPPEWSKFVTDVKLIDSGLAVPVFKQGYDPIDAINKMMSFLSGRQSSFAAGTSRTRTNISGGNNSGQQRVVKCFNCQEEGYGKVLNEEELAFLADLGVAKGLVTQTVITHNAAYQTDDLDAYDSKYDDISTGKAVLMANLSSYGSDVLSEDINSSAQQDSMTLSVFEHLLNQVTNCKKVNRDNLIANESLSAELERYKERVKLLEERQNMDLSTKEKLIIDDIIRDKNAQFADFEKEINSLKQTLFEQLKEKETLKTTFNVLKNESKEKEAKNIDKEIALEKKVKELDNIKAQQIRPMLYDGTVIAKETNAISIADLEETLMLEKCFENQKKQFLIENDRLLDQIISQDIVNIVMNSSVDMNTSVNINSSVVMNDSVNYVQKCNKCLELEAELIKQHNMEKVFVITSLKNDLRKLKGKDVVDNAAQVSNATTIAPGMYKLDPADILREIVEQAKSLNPIDSASYSACKYVKLIQELLGYVRDTCLDIQKPSEKFVAVTPINKKKTVSSMFDARHELCFLEFVSDINACSKSKFVKKAKKKEEWKPTEVVAQEPVVTKVYTRRPMVPKTIGSNSKPKIAKTMISNKTEPGTSRRSNTSVAPSSSSPVNLRLSELFCGSGKPPSTFQIGDMMASSIICLLSKASKTLLHLNFGAINHLAKNGLVRGPGLQLMTPASSSSGLVTNPIPQKPCNPPNRDDWDRLFQSMFDEYFNPPTIAVSPVPVAAKPRAVDIANSPVSTSIDLDAPSISITSTQEQEHSSIISQGFKGSPKTPHFHDDPLHEYLHEDSTSHGSSSNVRPSHTPFEHLGR
ncbi:hypothetical protein Tco_0351095, partial [Tanacetum coccineum]